MCLLTSSEVHWDFRHVFTRGSHILLQGNSELKISFLFYLGHWRQRSLCGEKRFPLFIVVFLHFSLATIHRFISCTSSISHICPPVSLVLYPWGCEIRSVHCVVQSVWQTYKYWREGWGMRIKLYTSVLLTYYLCFMRFWVNPHSPGSPASCFQSVTCCCTGGVQSMTNAKLSRYSPADLRWWCLSDRRICALLPGAAHCRCSGSEFVFSWCWLAAMSHDTHLNTCPGAFADVFIM